jgi:hypothetical protein
MPRHTLPLVALLAACNGAITNPDTGAPPIDDEPDDTDVTALALPATPPTDDGRFATSHTCAECHSNAPGATAMRDAGGAPIAPVDLWAGTMMANSARDPLWRAAVSAEAATAPDAAAAIEGKCVRCHAPMAHETARLVGEGPIRLADLAGTSERAHLGRDGVSCAACHQIEPEGLGTEASFSGGWRTAGDRTIYGPHRTPFDRPMVNRSRFTPVWGPHTLQAELCATCHQQNLATLDADGGPTGDVIHEQSVYAEWRASAAGRDGVTCQDCHLPTVDDAGRVIATPIARNPMGGDFGQITARAPYGRHLLVGGNTLVPQMFEAFPDVLQPTAPPAAFAATREAATRMLTEATATLDLDGLATTDDRVRFSVAVQPRTGHRFPTGIPIRRAWLRVQVRDAAGALVFSSGAHDERGRLLGPDGALHPAERVDGPVLPHFATVRDPSEVQVYEAILAGVDGEPVWRLIQGAAFYKDNRLFPAGWAPVPGDEGRTAAVGVDGDPDFGPGGDVVAFDVPVGGEPPYAVTAELLFQPLSNRWGQELLAVDTDETRAFGAMWRSVDRTPVVVATARGEAR